MACSSGVHRGDRSVGSNSLSLASAESFSAAAGPFIVDVANALIAITSEPQPRKEQKPTEGKMDDFFDFFSFPPQKPPKITPKTAI
jgi:hypothetical protein